MVKILHGNARWGMRSARPALAYMCLFGIAALLMIVMEVLADDQDREPLLENLIDIAFMGVLLFGMVFLWLARRRSPPVLRSQQRAGRLVRQEGQSAEYDPFDGEACGIGRSVDSVLIACRRQSARSVWRERFDLDRLRTNWAEGLFDGARPAVLRRHRREVGKGTT